MMTKPKPKGGLALLIGMSKDKGATEDDMDTMPPENSDGGAEAQHDYKSDTTAEGSYVTPPKGFMAPENRREGEDFSGTFRGHMMPDGRLCLVDINGMPMGDEPEKVDNQEEESTEDDSQSTEDNTAGKADMSMPPDQKKGMILKKLLHRS